MKESPICYNTAMMRALLDDRKTQTRRPVRPQPPSRESVRRRSGSKYDWTQSAFHPLWRPVGPVWSVRDLMGMEPSLKCRYGGPGDRLCPRENWQSIGYGRWFGCEVHYQADGHNPLEYEQRRKHRRIIQNPPDRDDRFRPLTFGKWHPSIHMPRWMARELLEIESVRLVPVQDITPEEVLLEGIVSEDPIRAYAVLWDSIYGKKYPWNDNPWVWVITHKRLLRPRMLFLDDNVARHDLLQLYESEKDIEVFHCYTIDEFKEELGRGKRFDIISIDYDLNNFERCSILPSGAFANGLDACGYLSHDRFSEVVPDKIHVHSTNQTGAQKMVSYLIANGFEVHYKEFQGHKEYFSRFYSL